MSNVFQKWLFRRTIGAQVIQDRPADGFAEGGCPRPRRLLLPLLLRSGCGNTLFFKFQKSLIIKRTFQFF